MATKHSVASVDELLKTAQQCRMDLSSVLSPELYEIIAANADAVGAPPEFILFPLLTATASFMGTNAHVTIKEEWKEPSIIWFVLAAKERRRRRH